MIFHSRKDCSPVLISGKCKILHFPDFTRDRMIFHSRERGEQSSRDHKPNQTVTINRSFWWKWGSELEQISPDFWASLELPDRLGPGGTSPKVEVETTSYYFESADHLAHPDLLAVATGTLVPTAMARELALV